MRYFSKNEPLILQAINRALPPSFIRALAHDVEWAYKEAYSASQSDPLLDASGAEYSYPHYRLAILEKRIRASANAAGIAVVQRYNLTNTYGYVELQSNGWCFTIKHCERYRMPRPSEFRKQDASINSLLSQTLMTPIMGLGESATQFQYNAIVYHSTDAQNPSVPNSIRIGVPSEDYNNWLATFDIYELLESILDDDAPEDEVRTLARWKDRAKRDTAS